MKPRIALLGGALVCLAMLHGCTDYDLAFNSSDDGMDAQSAPVALSAVRNQHADLTSPITSRNVGQMGLAWKIEMPENVSHTPLVDGQHLFFADWGGSVYKVDKRSGDVIWKRDIEKPQKKWPWHGFCGTGALSDGVLFEASAEGTAFAIDADTGEVIWRADFASDEHAGNCGTLLAHGNLLYIPVSSVEEPLSKMQDIKPDFQGKVVALDTRTGRKVWERQLVEKPHNGVAVWSGFALDPQLNMLYFTTGNNYTGEATELSDAVIAVDARTGEIRWVHQATPHDVWTMAEPVGPDYDFGAAPQLFEATIEGQRRELVGAGQKSGTYWALDRRTGKPVWTTTIGYGQVGGGIHAEASIGDGRIYLWGNNAYPYHSPNEHPMDIKAVNAATGAYLWSNPKAQPAVLISAGFLANDVYFVGSLDGKVRAYRATDGQKLWESQATRPIASPLWADGSMVYFGAGVPAHYGGATGGGGVYAFSTAAPVAERFAGQTNGRPTTRPIKAGIPAARDQTGEVRRIEIIARDYDFDPSQVTVRPGQRLQVVLVNKGAAPHSIEFHLAGDREAELANPIPPGEQSSLAFTAPQKPGKYVYYCPVGNHRALGMEGTLVVKADQ